jgi:hypothetical protein
MCLGVFAEPHQAFVKTIQPPDVLRVLTGPRQGTVETGNPKRIAA